LARVAHCWLVIAPRKKKGSTRACIEIDVCRSLGLEISVVFRSITSSRAFTLSRKPDNMSYYPISSISFYEEEMSRYPPQTPYNSISPIARSNSSQGSSSALSPQSMSSPISPRYTQDIHNEDWTSQRYGSWAQANPGSSTLSSGTASWSDPGAFDYSYGAQGSEFAAADSYSTPIAASQGSS